MTKKDLNDFKKSTSDLVKQIVRAEGSMFPALIILVDNHPDASTRGKKGAMVVKIPEAAMENSKTKQVFVEKGLPLVVKQLKRDGLIVSCVCFCSEVWIREAKDTKTVPKNWKEIPPQDGLIMSYSTAKTNEALTYLIKKNSNLMTDSNNISANTVELELHKSLSDEGENNSVDGLFSNLFNRFFAEDDKQQEEKV